MKLTDFGSAEWFGDESSMSGVVGTSYYMASEVVMGREYDEKVDLWSCGVILYIILGGIPPFYGDSAVEIFESVVRANLRFPSRIFRTVSPTAKDLLRRIICRDPSRRISAEQALSKFTTFFSFQFHLRNFGDFVLMGSFLVCRTPLDVECW